MVITSRNPVHAVLWLILAFCNSAGIVMLTGAEFLAMMLIIIYVGAVAVLFLFVVMMLNVKASEIKNFFSAKLGLAFSIAVFLFIDLVAVIFLSSQNISASETHFIFRLPAEISNSHAIGRFLYTDFILPFQTAGIILFAAMVASITLTMRVRTGVKKQKPAEQLLKNKKNSMFLAKNTGKSGLDNLKYDD